MMPQKPNANPRMIEPESIQVSVRFSPFLFSGVLGLSGPVEHLFGQRIPHSLIFSLYIDGSIKVCNSEPIGMGLTNCCMIHSATPKMSTNSESKEWDQRVGSSTSPGILAASCFLS
jgi:hypothetical protein